TLGEYRLPTAWVPAAAVNDLDVGARRMSSALMARFLHVDMGGEVTSQWLDDVSRLAVQRDWHPMVLAFLRSFPKHLHEYNPKARVSPNPRAWEFVSQVCYQNPPRNLIKSIVQGQVGDGAGEEFFSFYELFSKLPNLDNVIMNPATAEVPAQPSQLYAMVAGFARRVTEKNFGQILVYLDRLPADYNVCCVTDCVRRNKALHSLPEFTKWAVKFHEVVL